MHPISGSFGTSWHLPPADCRSAEVEVEVEAEKTEQDRVAATSLKPQASSRQLAAFGLRPVDARNPFA
jgi:hypothetical protein